MASTPIPSKVPSKVRVINRVRGDFPFSATTIGPGVYDCKSNQYGAVSVVAENGYMLGLKPEEFETLEWRENKEAE